MTDTAKRAAGATLISLLTGVALIAGPLAGPADAATFAVATPTEFAAAVGGVNGADGDHTITLTADLDFTDWSPMYFSANVSGTPKNVTIDGAGHRAFCDPDGGECASWLSVAIGTNGSMTLDDISIEGFQEGAVYLFDTSLSVVDSTFADNSHYASTDVFTPAHGGAITDRSSSPSVSIDIENSVFTNNLVYAGNGYGGAIYASSSLSVVGSTFTGNTAYGAAGDGQGGAIYAWEGTTSIEDSTFEGNYAIAGSDARYGAGGAVQAHGAELDVLDSTFELNSATGPGGGINFDGGVSADVTGTDFTENAAERGGAIAMADDASLYVDGGEFKGNTASWQGGAINLYGAYAEIDFATFRGNESNSHGGAILVGGDEIENDWSEAWISDSLFVANEAGSGGGAMGVYQDSAAFVDSTTFTENEASDGAAISSTFSHVSLSHVTMADNVPYSEVDEGNGGGQIWMQGIELTLSGTVIVGAGENRANCIQSIPSIVYAQAGNRADDLTCFETGDGDIAATDFDAQLGPLQFNGGPTWTMLPGPDSPLVDAWATGGQGACDAETADQRTVLRPQGDACDIGAAEVFEPILWEVETPNGTVHFRIHNATNMDNVPRYYPQTDFTDPPPPAGVAFPYGIYGLLIDVHDDGWPAFVELAAPAPTSQLWKLTSEGWAEYPAEHDGLVWSFTLVDGGAGDNDGVANAQIADPVGAGVVASFTG